MTDKKLAASLKAAQEGVRKRDVIDVRDPPPEDAGPKLVPTPEQMARVEYRRGGSKVTKGQVSSLAYHRVPHFETLALQSKRIDEAGLAALRFYREAYEAQAASPTRCALNDEGRGGGLPLCIPFSIAGTMLEDLHGGTILDIIERQLGATLPTMRAVALEDQSFSAVAIARFGSRKVGWIEQQKRRGTDRKGNRMAYVDKVAPLSGRHREIIAEEFYRGLALLVAAHAPYVSTVRIHPFQPSAPVSAAEAELTRVATETPAPMVDPAFLNDAGRMRPMAEIADIIRERAAEEPDGA